MTTLTTTTNTALTVLEPQALDKNPAAVYLAGLQSPRSRRTMRKALDICAGILAEGSDALTFPWGRLRFQHAQALRSILAERYKLSWANLCLSAMRGACGAAWKLGQMAPTHFQRIKAEKGLTGHTEPHGRALTPGEIGALLTACGNDQRAAGVRDGAILALLYGLGLRRAEVVGLDLDDFDQVGDLLYITGKGSKERKLPVENGARAALADWLTVRGSEPGPMFWPMRKGGELLRRRMSTQSIYHILAVRAAQARVVNISPHDMRRSFASDLLDAGADLSVVAGLMGHASTDTTRQYDKRGDTAKRQAASLLHVPYIRRILA